MNVELKTLPQSRVELTITMSTDDMQPHLTRAANQLSENRDIKGFRRGKAPYEKVEQEFGAMAIYEAALEKIVQAGYYAATKEKKVKTIGMPEVAIKKMAPGNDLEFTATAAVLPSVTLPNLEKITVEKKSKTVSEQETKDALENLRKMRGSEVIKNGAATKEDKVVVDMELLLDNVVVEGGTTKDHGVYLGEDYYVPGLPEQLIGSKKGDEKSFTLPFPKEHYQKHLAGKEVQFKVKVKDVFERQFPKLDDEFAKGLGQESLAKLTELLQKNMQAEADKKEHERQEIEMLEGIITKAKFDEIPQLLIDTEKRRIFMELKSRIEQQGMTVEQYLESIKKSQDEVMEGYAQQAEKRVKTTLVLRTYCEQESIAATDEEIEKEIQTMKGMYKDNAEALEQIDTQDTRESLKPMLANRKAVDQLRELIIK